MQKKSDLKKICWRVAFTATLVTICASILFILGWYLGITPFIHPPGTDTKVSFGGSICLFLSGISLIALLYQRYTIANKIGFLIVLISGWRFIEIIFNQEFGQTTFFQGLLPQASLPIKPMSELACINFLLIGLIYFFWKEKTGGVQSLIRLFVSQIVIILSSIGLLVYILPVHTINLWPGSQQFSLYLSSCVFLIGLGLAAEVIFNFWEISKKQVSLSEDLRKKLEEAQHNLITSMESAEIGSWRWDFESHVINLDRQAQALFGYEFGIFSGSLDDLLERIYPIDTPVFEEGIKGHKNDSKGMIKFEIRIVMPNHALRFLKFRGHLFKDGKENPIRTYGSLWDETRTKFAQQRLELSQEVIRVLSDATAVKEALTKILATLNKSFGTEVISLWIWNQKKQNFDCLDIAYAEKVQNPMFKEVNRELLGKDLTVPELVMSTLRPISIPDLTEFLPNKIRGKLSDQLQGVIAFPIFQANAVIGVVELFKRSPRIMPIDEGMEKLLITLGTAIGQFIQRIEARKAQEQLISIVTHSNDALLLLDTQGFVQSWNYGATRIFGYNAEEAIGNHATKFIPDEEVLVFGVNLAIVLSGQFVENLQMKMKRKDGGIIWGEVSAAPIKDKSDHVTHGSVVIKDITQEKENNLIIYKNEEKLRAIMDTTEEWIWEMNTKHIYTYSSPSVSKILGFTSNEVLNEDMIIFLFDEDREKAKEEFIKNIDWKQGWRKRIMRFKHRDGSERFLESNAVPNFNEEGKVIGLCGSDRDVTENINIEKNKSEFISLVSHELRTPLTSILGTLGLILGKSSISDEIKQLLTIAYRNSNRLKELINNLLDIQKVKFKKFSFTLQPISLDAAINESVDSARVVAKKERIELILKEPLPHVIVNGDHEHFLQVLGNFISNAIKFSPPDKKVIVSHEIRGDRIRVSVSDQGKGIPKEFQPKVFGMFARAETGAARTTPGTGLGLCVSKGIIDQCGGTIGFETEEGVGTTFYFELPIVSKEE